MTDEKNKNQDELLEAVDAMLDSGGRIDAGGAEAGSGGDRLDASQTEENRALHEIARQLVRSRPQPSARFVAQTERRITASGQGGKWLPAWITAPKMAAALAVLVVGLGIAGLTGALVSGGRPSSVRDQGESIIQTSPSAGGDFRRQQDSLDSFPGDSDGSVSDEIGVYAPEGVDTAGAAAGTSAIGAPQSLGGTLPALPSTSRVIQNADYDIEVPRGDFSDRFNRLSELATRYGGFIVSANSSKSGEDEPQTGSITMRIANTGDNFSRVQADIEAMGGVLSKNVSGTDVTEEFVDLESRLRSAQAQEAQMLELLKRAETVNEVLMVQARLAEIQAQIEQIKGRMNYIASRTDFATVVIGLREEGVIIEDEDDNGLGEWGFVSALRYAAWLAVQTVNFVIVGLGILVPAFIIALVFVAAGYRIYRWRRSRQT